MPKSESRVLFRIDGEVAGNVQDLLKDHPEAQAVWKSCDHGETWQQVGTYYPGFRGAGLVWDDQVFEASQPEPGENAGNVLTRLAQEVFAPYLVKEADDAR